MRCHLCPVHLILHFPLALLPLCSLHVEMSTAIPTLEQSLAVFPNQAPLQFTSPNDLTEVNNSGGFPAATPMDPETD